MIFNIYVAVNDLKNSEAKDPRGKTYAVCIGDTVLVNDADTPAAVLTTGKKRAKNISIFLKVSGSDNFRFCRLQLFTRMTRAIQTTMKSKNLKRKNFFRGEVCEIAH